MENTEEKLKTITPELDNKQTTTQTPETPKKVHGNVGKKKSEEWKKNHALKMKAVWAEKKATPQTN